MPKYRIFQDGTYYDTVFRSHPELALSIARDCVPLPELYPYPWQLPKNVHISVQDEYGEEVAVDYVFLDTPSNQPTIL
jgi:hypothetical protein